MQSGICESVTVFIPLHIAVDGQSLTVHGDGTILINGHSGAGAEIIAQTLRDICAALTDKALAEHPDWNASRP